MSGWNEIAEGRKPAGRVVDIGAKAEKFIAEKIGSFAAIKALFQLMECAPQPRKTAELAKQTGETKEAILPALEKLAEEGMVECRKSFLTGASWRYMKDNPYAHTAYAIRKLWLHPRTHNIVMCKILQADTSLGR
ncbi:MAG: hypothetical protein JXR97_13585 [Planctomycetes bacterium]|nr:hypothetical protein [Planctomycetota bacterium]